MVRAKEGKRGKREEQEERVKREIDLSKYVSIFAITALIFILGILVGNYIAHSRLGELEKAQEELTAQMMGLGLKDALLKYGDVCSLTWQEIWKEKVEMGEKIEKLEARLGKDNSDVLRQKEIYELIEIRTWLLLKEIKEKCNEDLEIILYFYTNDKDDPKGSWRQCEMQGYVLDALYQRYPDKVNIFAFDINTKNPATDILQQLYNITKVPSLVIKEKLYTEYINLATFTELVI